MNFVLSPILAVFTSSKVIPDDPPIFPSFHHCRLPMLFLVSSVIIKCKTGGGDLKRLRVIIGAFALTVGLFISTFTTMLLALDIRFGNPIPSGVYLIIFFGWACMIAGIYDVVKGATKS